MKHQALFSSIDKVKIIKMLSAAVLHGALRVNEVERLLVRRIDTQSSFKFML